MRKITLLFLFSCGIAVSFAQDHNCSFYGTKTMYHTAGQDTATPPAGYVPVFINYVGRHGARHVSSLKEVLFVATFLKTAESSKALTPDGLLLKKMTDDLVTIESKNKKPGLITQSGAEELKEIARRMKTNYPMLFSSENPHFIVTTTKVERTRQSAQAFLDGLGYSIEDSAHLTWRRNDSVNLRFYDLAPAYQEFKDNGDWEKQMDQLYQSAKNKETARQIASTFFKKPFAEKLLHPQAKSSEKTINAQEFADALYGIASIYSAIQYEIKEAGFTPEEVNINSLLTCDQLDRLEFINSASDFLLKGPGTNVSGIQVKIAAPLLVDLINTTDSFIQNGKDIANLRFTHGEAIAPLAALMRIGGASSDTKDIMSYRKIWQADSVIPFSSNIQWILYRNPGSPQELLVKILFNEKPATIPVSTSSFPYYRWADVKAFYGSKLKTFGVASLNDDMYDYLQHVK